MCLQRLLSGCLFFSLQIAVLPLALLSSGKRQDEVAFDVSPVGNRIVFTAIGDGGSDLYLLDLETKQAERVAKTPDFEGTPAFSPDGKEIVFSASKTPGKSAHLFVCSLNGTNRRQLTFDSSVYDQYPPFSADGKHIAFARAARHRPYSMGGWTWDQWDIWGMKADGTQAHRLTHDGRSFAPAFSRDGKQIVFLSDRITRFDYEVWRMRADGSKPVQVTRNGSYNQNPRWARDGKAVLFLSDPKREIRYDLWRADADGHNLRMIADNRLFDDPLHWKPR
jgi:TolB protein